MIGKKIRLKELSTVFPREWSEKERKKNHLLFVYTFLHLPLDWSMWHIFSHKHMWRKGRKRRNEIAPLAQTHLRSVYSIRTGQSLLVSKNNFHEVTFFFFFFFKWIQLSTRHKLSTVRLTLSTQMIQLERKGMSIRSHHPSSVNCPLHH